MKTTAKKCVICGNPAQYIEPLKIYDAVCSSCDEEQYKKAKEFAKQLTKNKTQYNAR